MKTAMTAADLRVVIIDQLERLLADKGKSRKRDGICTNMYLGWCGYTFVGDFSQGWIHHTGNRSWPVPLHQATLALNCWLNPYRIELCQYLLEKARATPPSGFTYLLRLVTANSDFLGISR